jgi:radical SAM superfamily enzyme YgiQ (UPF0313 family)
METYPLGPLHITLNKEGAKEYIKVGFPLRYGLFSEIETSEYLYQFTRNGEIKFIQGKGVHGLPPSEWLKHTAGNDWIYYSAGDYQGFHNLIGEYYYPYLPYSSNSIMEDEPFSERIVHSAMAVWRKLQAHIKEQISHPMDRKPADFLKIVLEKNEETLRQRGEQFHEIIGGPVTVLPPDTRHVDYEVIPLTVADGCLYNCGFCRVKSGRPFMPRTREDILEQIEALKRFYAEDLPNYNSLFLGQHDALYAGSDLLEFAAGKAYERLEFEGSYLKGCHLFFFGSVDSLLHSEEKVFESLNRLPYSTHINIGLESVDPATLATLRKPLSSEKVGKAFSRMGEINGRYGRIEITANFVFGNNLPLTHFDSLFDLVAHRWAPSRNKGALYLSPLMGERMRERGRRKELLRKFNQLKMESHLPTFLYLIQRL